MRGKELCHTSDNSGHSACLQEMTLQQHKREFEPGHVASTETVIEPRRAWYKESCFSLAPIQQNINSHIDHFLAMLSCNGGRCGGRKELMNWTLPIWKNHCLSLIPRPSARTEDMGMRLGDCVGLGMRHTKAVSLHWCQCVPQLSERSHHWIHWDERRVEQSHGLHHH